MLAGLKTSADASLTKIEKENKLLVDKFSALAVECEEISYEALPSKKKKNTLLERCDKLSNETSKLENKITKITDESVKAKQETVLKSVNLLMRRTMKMKKAIGADKIEKEEIRKARECGEISEDSEDDTDNDEKKEESETEKNGMQSEDESKDESSDEADGSDEEYEDDEDDVFDNAIDVKDSMLYESMCAFEAQEDETDDLGFQTGELLKILEMRDDGWWLAENESGEKGLVPSTYLKVHQDYDANKKTSEDSEDADSETTRRSSILWSNIRNAVKETSATDVLTALGALPSGFRHSTLGTSLADGDKYTCKAYIRPKLCKSGLGFNDLYWDPNTSQIRGRATRILRFISLVRCTNIPLPGAGVEVLSRHVRLCLFDGISIVSNIHTVRAKWDSRAPRTWSFTPKISINSSTIEEAECFVRSNSTDANISILFELCVSYIRPSTSERGELSCGWVSQRLLDDSGLPVPNRNKELYVNGGTPFEKGVEVDPSVARREVSNSLRVMISRNRQPRFVVKIATPSREQKEQLDLLPDIIINNMQALPFLALYRQMLADALLRDRIRAESSERIHAPVLSMFPTAIDQHDLLDMLRNAWNERQRTEKRVNKRDREMRKQMFRKVYMETVYIVLCHTNLLPAYKFADNEILQQRRNIIDDVMANWKEQGTVSILLAANTTHKPFNINELSLDILTAECAPPVELK